MPHRARKRFGQHFLTDRSVIHAIVDAISPREGQLIVEIGPGLAALTDALLERVGQLHAIEIDRDLAAALRERHPPERLVLHQADALAFDFAHLARQVGDGRRLRVVGNLPYNISSPLLVALLSARDCIQDQHFMLQKEVVDRLVASPGTAEFGRLSVLMQAFHHCERLFDVAPESFDPAPRVWSSVVRMSVRTERLGDDPAPLQQVLAVAFGQRRKMLRGTLLPWLAGRGLAPGAIEPTARPEEIGVDTWLELSRRLRQEPVTAV
jgi:16S rRNA (adenine1518-N6/adenine1519-N6)-dimethyltransferase